MRYRRLAERNVSVVGIGCNQFGPTADASAVDAIVGRAFDAGVNFFDTADEYGPDGISEELLGHALSGRRDEAVIATKFGYFVDGDRERGGASARWIVHAVEASLRRLGTDRIDLYQQHFPDPDVAPEETLRALDQLVRDGKVLHHGLCNLSSNEIAERASIARAGALSAPIASQNRYNLLRQEARDELIPMLEDNAMMLLPYFPLASGMLTGKYKSGRPLPPDSRFTRHLSSEQAARIIERDSPAIERLEGWALARGRSVAELAIAWLASQPVVASVIAGVTKTEQVDANARAAEWVLTSDEIEEVGSMAMVTPSNS